MIERPGSRFGRTKSDPARLAGIAEHRADAIDRLLMGIRDGIDDARRLLDEVPEPAWETRGLHPVRGSVPVGLVAEEFIVKHLEEHADQLASLR